MSATANDLYRKLNDITRLITEIRADIAALQITDSTIKDQEHLPRTGWRWIRGDGGISGTYKQDPQGTDRLPPGYDLTVHRHPDRTRDDLHGFGEGAEATDAATDATDVAVQGTTE